MANESTTCTSTPHAGVSTVTTVTAFRCNPYENLDGLPGLLPTTAPKHVGSDRVVVSAPPAATMVVVLVPNLSTHLVGCYPH